MAGICVRESVRACVCVCVWGGEREREREREKEERGERRESEGWRETQASTHA